MVCGDLLDLQLSTGLPHRCGVNRPGTPPKVGQPAWNEARRTASPYIAPPAAKDAKWQSGPILVGLKSKVLTSFAVYAIL